MVSALLAALADADSWADTPLAKLQIAVAVSKVLARKISVSFPLNLLDLNIWIPPRRAPMAGGRLICERCIGSRDWKLPMRFYPTKMTPVTTISARVSEVYVFTRICGKNAPDCAPGRS